MRRYQRGGHWNHPFLYIETNAHWRVREGGVVTTRYGAALEAAAAAEQNTQQPPTEVALVTDDSGIGSLHAHDEKEPTHAIAATPGMRTIAIKSGVLAVLSHFYGLSKECPYAFLEEFCRYCDIQPVPAGSTSEDYRLKAIPFVLKGDAGVWLSRLPEGSIRTWAEFRMIFLDHFFPASKTSALKREITEARQEYDEPLGQYWDRFQGLLQACPNTSWGSGMILLDLLWRTHCGLARMISTSQPKGIFSKPHSAKPKTSWSGLLKPSGRTETSRGQYRRGAVRTQQRHAMMKSWRLGLNRWKRNCWRPAVEKARTTSTTCTKGNARVCAANRPHQKDITTILLRRSLLR
ncbi:hypothetical protein SASPL_150491 [Salvia splendens]|uniref:Retrotransposon gag domain-containing protein n=1 Tax=Salvia splendens TaxID=180675 RepID=A0A8X8W658_SALSN|nr:hypothetical protein SASPL_150491 [Salvia splendens]